MFQQDTLFTARWCLRGPLYYQVVWFHMEPGDGWLAVCHLVGVSQIWTVQHLPLLQMDNHRACWSGDRRLAVDATEHLVRPQHRQTHGDLTAGRLVPARQRQDAD